MLCSAVLLPCCVGVHDSHVSDLCTGLPFEKAFALRVDHAHLYALDYGVTGFELKYGNCGTFA